MNDQFVWIFPTLVLLCAVVVIIIALRKHARHAIYSSAIQGKSFDQIYRHIKSLPNCHNIDFKSGEFVYFEMVDGKYLVSFATHTPVLKTLTPVNVNILVLLPVVLSGYSAIERMISSEFYQNAIFVLLFLMMSCFLFNERKGFAVLFSKSKRQGLRQKHDKLVETLRKETKFA